MLIKLKPNLACAPRRVNIVAIATLTVSSLLFSNAAHAADFEDEVKVTIQASDLESEAGIVNIYEVLTKTAVASCTENVGRTLADRRMEALCTDDLVDDFVSDIANPELTALHNESISAE